MSLDCDGDCVLQVEQTGGACRLGEYSCFSIWCRKTQKVAKFVAALQLYDLIGDRPSLRKALIPVFI